MITTAASEQEQGLVGSIRVEKGADLKTLATITPEQAQTAARTRYPGATITARWRFIRSSNTPTLFGKDVIVAHRLMKNTIAHHEYALFTDTLVRACPTWVVVVTEGFEKDETRFCFSETDPKGNFSCNYVFERIDEETCRFREEVYLKDTALLRLVYRILIKKKITHQADSSFALLEALLNQPQASERPRLAVG